jgi:PDZ domain-containing protein
VSDRYATGVVAALTLIALVCLAFIVPVPYIAMRPGPAFNTLGDFGSKHMFGVRGAETYPTKGALRFTTVSVSSSAAHFTLAEALLGVINPDVELLPRELVYREGSTSKENKQESATELASSKDNSRVAALRAAGFAVPEVSRVVAVTKGAPADGKIRVGDVIVKVDDKDTRTSDRVVAAVRRHQPGTDVALTVRRGAELVTVHLSTTSAPGGGSRVGVALHRAFSYPVTITNNVDDSIGGSSAGTMFALAIYDLLTPGSLTGGLDVAGTGEIDADGVVRPIGGIRQKMAGAAHDGADYFLVPAANCSDALRGDDDGMRRVKIATLRDAIDSIEKLAADSQAEVPTCH